MYCSFAVLGLEMKKTRSAKGQTLHTRYAPAPRNRRDPPNGRMTKGVADRHPSLLDWQQVADRPLSGLIRKNSSSLPRIAPPPTILDWQQVADRLHPSPFWIGSRLRIASTPPLAILDWLQVADRLHPSPFPPILN